ncbi:hypothetical protein MZM54_26340 [[Brevibacterium] frigoritolerans]|nr:hypothetical protein [Peribacillus frigoritolerans]
MKKRLIYRLYSILAVGLIWRMYERYLKEKLKQSVGGNNDCPLLMNLNISSVEDMLI